MISGTSNETVNDNLKSTEAPDYTTPPNETSEVNTVTHDKDMDGDEVKLLLLHLHFESD